METLEQLQAWINPALVLTGAILFLALVNGLLERHYGNAPGSRQRRQVSMLGLGFCAMLLVVVSLPISEVLRGQILSLIGILLSAMIALASTTFVGNIMAGIMLGSLRSFKAGDFIQVGEHFGRVSDRGLLHVEIQTEDRDLTTLPNLFVVTNPVKVVHAEGTIVSASLSLGYDVPRHAVEPLLLEATGEAGLQDGFVQIIELGDFSISYRAAGMLPEPTQLLSARSRLRALILDHLHAAGIEIVSPNFMNTRAFDPDRQFIPPVPRKTEPEAENGAPAPENLVFDKAEEAASTEQLRGQVDELAKEIRDLEKVIRDAQKGHEREQLEAQLKKMHRRHERYAQVLQARDAAAESKKS